MFILTGNLSFFSNCLFPILIKSRTFNYLPQGRALQLLFGISKLAALVLDFENLINLTYILFICGVDLSVCSVYVSWLFMTEALF